MGVVLARSRFSDLAREFRGLGLLLLSRIRRYLDADAMSDNCDYKESHRRVLHFFTDRLTEISSRSATYSLYIFVLDHEVC